MNTVLEAMKARRSRQWQVTEKGLLRSRIPRTRGRRMYSDNHPSGPIIQDDRAYEA